MEVCCGLQNLHGVLRGFHFGTRGRTRATGSPGGRIQAIPMVAPCAAATTVRVGPEKMFRTMPKTLPKTPTFTVVWLLYTSHGTDFVEFGAAGWNDSTERVFVRDHALRLTFLQARKTVIPQTTVFTAFLPPCTTYCTKMEALKPYYTRQPVEKLKTPNPQS